MQILPSKDKKSQAVDPNDACLVVSSEDRNTWYAVESHSERGKALSACMILQKHWDKNQNPETPWRVYSVCPNTYHL